MKCGKCKKEYPANTEQEISAYFHADRTKSTGFSVNCKSCVAEYSRKKREYKNLEAYEKYKAITGAKTRRKMERKPCSVISCDKMGEFHHIDYADEDAVIPLCRSHHVAIHRMEKILKNSNDSQSQLLKEKDAEIKRFHDRANKLWGEGRIFAFQKIEEAISTANARLADQDNQLKAMALENIDVNIGLVKAVKVIVELCDSFHAHPIQHPSMFEAKERARQFLATLKKDGKND